MRVPLPSFAPDAVIRELRYALRSLRRTPGFTVAVVLTLAAGIGANGAVFSAVNTVLLKPLSFPDGDQLIRIMQVDERSGENNIAPVRLEDWNRLNQTFTAISGYYIEDASETSGEFPERIRRAFVAPKFVEVWGVSPLRGRGLLASEHLETGAKVVLVSERYWRNRLNADPAVLEREVRIGNTAFAIVGVMPASFRFPDRDVDMWFPVPVDAKYALSRRNTWFIGIGRMKSGVSLDQAAADLAAVQAHLGQEYPDSDRTVGVRLISLKSFTLGDIGGTLWLLFGGVSLVLLITCTNIAGLLLSRAAQRQQEIAVRLSLGASRVRVASQLLVEALVLALAGSAAGLALAGVATQALRRAAVNLPRLDEIAVDSTVVVYTLGIAIIVTVLCGVLPAFRAGREGSGGSPGDNSRTQVAGRHSLQWLLVGAQVAMSVVLLVGAGLLVRSVQELARVEAGFEPARVLTFRVSGNYAETVNYDRLTTRIDSTIDALRSLPGVESAATSLFLPGVPTEFEQAFTFVEARSETARQITAERRHVSSEYFATLKIPVIEGQVCDRQSPGGNQLILINQAFRSRYLADWPSPIGLHLATGATTGDAARIVGVAADARDHGIDRAPVPMVYACNSAPNPTPNFLVRTHGDPAALAQTVRITMREREPMRSVYDIAPLEDRIGGAFEQDRFQTIVLLLFAVTAVGLAAIGLYGTLSYIVSLRRREVGLRLALGAMRATIVRQFVAQGLKVTAGACVAGLAIALASTRLLEGMLFGVSPTDPLVIAAVIAVVTLVTMAGALIPACRASAVDPMEALRGD